MVPKDKNYFKKLLSSLNNKKSEITIVGLGYVGLPLALSFCEAGYKVIGIDIDEEKTKKINSGFSYINHISNKRIIKSIENNKLFATTDFSKTTNSEGIILCVPTPLGKNREPNLTFIKKKFRINDCKIIVNFKIYKNRLTNPI